MENQRHDYLIEHFGVKGMKWGVRRPLTSSGHIVGSPYAKGVSAVKRGTKALLEEGKAMKARGRTLEKTLKNPKKLKKMSDEEIKQYKERLYLENRLKILSSHINDEEASEVYKWRKFADDDRIHEINKRLQMEENMRQHVAQAKAYAKLEKKLGVSVMDIAGNTSVDVLRDNLKAPKGTKVVLSSDVLLDALKANAKKEPAYRKSFDDLMTEQMWRMIAEQATKKE